MKNLLHSHLVQDLFASFDIRSRQEGDRLGLLAAQLFLLIAANNIVKILRDSIFLGHHSVSELPYLYILVAVIAGVTIATYTRFTVQLSLVRLMLATHAIAVGTIAGFWFLLTYIDPGWSHYAFYIWSAMATVIAVAQLWTLAGQIFTPAEGKRVFGLVAAGGTVGGIAAGFGVKWLLSLDFETNHLLWVVAGLYAASALVLCLTQGGLKGSSSSLEYASPDDSEAVKGDNIFATLAVSPYLKTIAALILVSVIVSTLIDFELKTAAKNAYSTKASLAVFFSSYYGWLSSATLFAQVLLTGKTLSKLGVVSSLYITPMALAAGSLAIMLWPGLVAASLTRIADATLRNSIHRSSMEILYMGVPAKLKKSIKTFLDVVLERIGDASAGFIILLVSVSSLAGLRTYMHFICVGLIILWIVLIRYLLSGYDEGLSRDVLEPDRSLLSSSVTARAKFSSGD